MSNNRICYQITINPVLFQKFFRFYSELKDTGEIL